MSFSFFFIFLLSWRPDYLLISDHIEELRRTVQVLTENQQRDKKSTEAEIARLQAQCEKLAKENDELKKRLQEC
jgi:sensor histidine kinase YesM